MKLLALVFLLAGMLPLFAGSAQSENELQRQQLIAQFTSEQEAMNWPEKFERIGHEMGVPPDVLASLAFTETRWQQLTWPAGETVSPDNGRPHPFGVMSLWDNDIMGHSLPQAASLIGSTPEALKNDPELNIRGAAALLKSYYQTTPQPEGTYPQEIESWQNAMLKYCGLPDSYLAYHHIFNCYLAMSQGYAQYGMHWTPHAVDLAPMRVKLKLLLAEHDQRLQSSNTPVFLPNESTLELEATNAPSNSPFELRKPAPVPAPLKQFPPARIVCAAAVLGGLLYYFRQKRLRNGGNSDNKAP